jgi:asparagine synthase (glutamine-hydrolysing)
VPEPRTIFRNAYKLQPGPHDDLLKVGTREVQPKRYWDVPFKPHAACPEADIEAS